MRGADITGYEDFMSSITQGEDCLRLNVYVPAAEAEGPLRVRSEPKGLMPVLVRIHGGSLLAGASNEYASDHITSRGVILVTINYRLGNLGFLGHPTINQGNDTFKTNFGMLDAIKALEWVRDNIESFGGDPANVSISGQSAGGEMVLALMVSPIARGLYQRVFIESATLGNSKIMNLTVAGEHGARLGRAMGVPEGPDQLDRMRELPWERFMSQETEEAMGFLSNVLYVDDATLPMDIYSAFEAGMQVDVPALIGFNANEGLTFYYPTSPPTQFFQDNAVINSTQDYEDYLFRSDLFPDWDSANLAYETYPAMNEAQLMESTARMLGDSTFSVPGLMIAELIAKSSNRTYLYHFTQDADKPYGGSHGAERHYIFGNPLAGLVFPVTNAALADQIPTYWTNFAKNGDPNGPGLPAWEPVSESMDEWFVLGDEIGLQPIPQGMLARWKALEVLVLRFRLYFGGTFVDS